MPSPSDTILGFGNPLLDISATVEQTVLDEWGASLNNAMLAEEKHQPLYQKLVETHKVDYIAGGATLNSIRVAQWMLKGANKTGNCHYIGCIGKDEFGTTMKKQLEADGVAGHFLEVDSKPTGTCAVLVKDNERSLIANLAAAEKYETSHFEADNQKAILEAAGIYYMAGFPLTHPGGLATVKAILEHSNAKGKTVCMNVSAPFLAEVPPLRALLVECFALCDYIFCNESEAVAFAKGEGWADAEDVTKVAEKLALLDGPKQKTRKAVVTQGADCTIIATSQGDKSSVEKVEVKGNPWTLTKADLVDTNGAGDAFVGGFLAGLAQGKGDAWCAEAGHFAAGTIIQRAGCTFPAECDFKPKTA